MHVSVWSYEKVKVYYKNGSDKTIYKGIMTLSRKYFLLLPTLMIGILHYISGDNCVSLEHYPLQCPLESNNFLETRMQKLIDECIVHERANGASGSLTSCYFFPSMKNSKGKLESCHLHAGANRTCTHGFFIRAARRKRKVLKPKNGSNFEYIYITVRFFGRIQPAKNIRSVYEVMDMLENETPGSSGETTNETRSTTTTPPPRPTGDLLESYKRIGNRFDSTEWLAIGISPLEALMGDDFVLYCHPFMDERFRDPLFSSYYMRDELKEVFENVQNASNYFYPENIGLAVTKYFTRVSGKQAFDVKHNFDPPFGKVVNGKVTFDVNEESWTWGFLDCQADISTYLLFTAAYNFLPTAVEIDMEVPNRNNHILMAIGPCLDANCFGNVPQNKHKMTAYQFSLMAYHRKSFHTPDSIALFDFSQINGDTIIFSNCYIILITLMILKLSL